VNIDNSEISSNTATYGGGMFIFSGTVNIDNSQISSNTAQYTGGGINIGCPGGFAYSYGSYGSYDSADTCPLVTIRNTQITSNTASSGGDIFITDAGLGSVSACHMDTQGIDIYPSAYEWPVCSPDPPATAAPTTSTTPAPTASPSSAPTSAPTPAPTASPSSAPTSAPTPAPTPSPISSSLACFYCRRSLLFGVAHLKDCNLC